MNGFVAFLTLPRRRAFRAVLIGALCVSSVLLVGAVRERQSDSIAAATFAPSSHDAVTPPAGAEVLASYSSAPDGRELLFDKPAVRAAAAASVPGKARAEIQQLSQPALPSLVARATVPTLAPRMRVMMMEVTAYCPCTRCCGPRAQGITASGKHVSYNGGRFVAADTRLLKFHTNLIIPGYADGRPVPVIDRGGAIKGHKLDVYFPTHYEARQWGRRKIPVTVIEE